MITFQLSKEERDALLNEAICTDDGHAQRLRFGTVVGKRLEYTWPEDEFGLFLDNLAADANGHDLRRVQKLLDRLLDRLEPLEAPGPPLGPVADPEPFKESRASVDDPPPGFRARPDANPMTHALVAELNARNVSPNDSNVQAILDEITAQLNATPQPELSGLSPAQASKVFYGEWNTPDGPLQFNLDLDPALAAESILLRNVRALVTMLDDAGGVKATQAKNLPRAFVAAYLEKLACLPGDTLMKPSGGTGNEKDYWLLHRSRVLAEIVGAIRLYKGKFVATKKGRKWLEDSSTVDLFFALFDVLFHKYNLAYGDRLPEYGEVQAFATFPIWAVRTHCEEWTDLDALREVAFPDFINDVFHPNPYCDHGKIALATRILRPMELLGLVDQQEVDAPDKAYPHKTKVRITPLFEQAVTFTL